MIFIEVTERKDGDRVGCFDACSNKEAKKSECGVCTRRFRIRANCVNCSAEKVIYGSGSAGVCSVCNTLFPDIAQLSKSTRFALSERIFFHNTEEK
jgi:hypothetical protein